MMCRLLCVFIVTMLTITRVQSLSCFYGALIDCPPKETVEKICPYGAVKDVCYQCWECAKGYKEKCGGIWSRDGRCAEGLRCSNPYDENFDYDMQGPGICCRNTPLIGRPLALPSCKTGAIRNPCSGEYECKKAHGEICGGPGDINGICADDLTCFPPLTDSTYDINATCISQDEIPPHTEDYKYQ